MRAALLLLLFPTMASAHAGQQSFVLLLPTDFYIGAGGAAVALTVVVLALVPARLASRIFASIPLARSRRPRAHLVTSTLSFLLLCTVLTLGTLGSTDPTRNPIPLYFWTVIWMILILAQGLIGDIWRWLNPWTGPLAIMRSLGLRPMAKVTASHWPALISLLALSYLMLVSPRSNDPPTLAVCLTSYWFIHFILALALGPGWLAKGEAMTLIMRCFGGLATLKQAGGRLRIGMPGWFSLRRGEPTTALAVFMIALLAIGSFDGFYRTFTWFSWTGQNPLEFGGRSTVIALSTLGLAVAIPLLIAAYALCLWIGMAAVGAPQLFARSFRLFAPALLPIAFVYHFAHYLPALLVEAQSIPIILNDPLGTGSNLFGWDEVQVTTGMFNRLDTVRTIFLAQSGAVVVGHVIAILMSHIIALRLLGTHKRAVLSQVPISLFMIAYTLFGLWLLASPQGA